MLTPPLTYRQRVDRYRHAGRTHLTPRQHRRMIHKYNQAVARGHVLVVERAVWLVP